jgi:3-methyladenine DNA glycosylase AlkD
LKFNNLYWTEENYSELIKYLKEISDQKYKEFSYNLIPGIDNILGIQIPKLRIIAKEIAKGNYNEFLDISNNSYHEEIMIKGLVIGYIQTDYVNTIKLIKYFLPYINNWATCDIFCTRFKAVLNKSDEFLEFLIECVNSNKEYYIRFAVVMFKVMYIDEKYIDKIFGILNNISHNGYYVKMAVAWTLCDCFIKFQDKTTDYLKLNNLDDFTYNKTLQKIIESNRVEDDTKNIIRKMKRK